MIDLELAPCLKGNIFPVIKSNDDRKISMSDKVAETMGGSVKGKTIAILGLAFKANTDDTRYSPALRIIPTLIEQGATIRAYDPEAIEQTKHELGEKNITYCTSTQAALSDADAVVIVTEWDEFKKLNLQEAKSLLKAPILIDLRNIIRPLEAKNAGFTYSSIGR